MFEEFSAKMRETRAYRGDAHERAVPSPPSGALLAHAAVLNGPGLLRRPPTVIAFIYGEAATSTRRRLHGGLFSASDLD